MYFAYLLESADETMYDAARQSVSHLTRVAQSEGQDVTTAPLYANYAMFDTPLERIYGDNLKTLRAIKAKYDPDNVMGLAGGWKF